MTKSRYSCPTTAGRVDNTHARERTNGSNPALNMHGSQQYTYLLVRLGAVWGILCPSKAPSVPFDTDNRSKFEQKATKPHQQCSQCVVFSFWGQSPNMVVTWHDCPPRVTECIWRCPNTPDFYRNFRHLAWEIHTILNTRVAMQKASGCGIRFQSR